LSILDVGGAHPIARRNAVEAPAARLTGPGSVRILDATTGEGDMPSTATIDTASGPMGLYVDAPEKPEARPAVLVMFHRGGIDDFTRAVAARLAGHGFVAAVPDLYHRRPDGEDTGESLKHVQDAEIMADVDASLGALRAMSNVDPARIGVVGHCFGGRNSFLVAVSRPDTIKACAIFYGGNMAVARGPGRPPLDLASAVACPVIGFFGNDDQNPSPADVDRLAALLKSHGMTCEFHRYDGAGHAFQNFTDKGRYRERQAEDAWSKLIPFLGNTLGVGARATAPAK
jgi:carboxymethylenebutenolidase